MSNSNTDNAKQKPAEGSNAVVIILIVLVLVAVGAIAYLSGATGAKEASGVTEVAEVTSEAQDAANAEPAANDLAASNNAEQSESPVAQVKPGNPTVAKLGDQEIKRIDVLNFIRTLGAASQQVPLDQLFPMALNQVVNDQIITQKIKTVNLDNDPQVKEQLEKAKAQIVRGVFMQKEIEKAITEDRLKAAYDQYLKNFPEVPEKKTRHILVKEEALAKDILAKIAAGEEFSALEQEHSIDEGSKANGGELGFMSRQDNVVPEFLDAVFAMKSGDLSKEPVKTQFGYHIIEVLEERNRPPADYEVAKPFLESQLRNVVLSELLDDWRAKSDVEVFDINGEAIEPAAGEEEVGYTQPVPPKEAVE